MPARAARALLGAALLGLARAGGPARAVPTEFVTARKPVPWSTLFPRRWSDPNFDAQRRYLRDADRLQPPRTLTAHVQVLKASRCDSEARPRVVFEKAAQTRITHGRQEVLVRGPPAASASVVATARSPAPLEVVLRPSLPRLIEKVMQEGLAKATALSADLRVRVLGDGDGGPLDARSRPIAEALARIDSREERTVPAPGGLWLSEDLLVAAAALRGNAWQGTDDSDRSLTDASTAYCRVDCQGPDRCQDINTSVFMRFEEWRLRNETGFAQPRAYHPALHDRYAVVQIFVGNEADCLDGAQSSLDIQRESSAIVSDDTRRALQRYGLGSAAGFAALDLNGTCLAVDPVVYAPMPAI